MMKSWYLLSLFSAYFMVISTAVALLPRQDSPSLTKCPNNLPFSCRPNSECIPTNSKNTSVICCPQGTDCTVINQITCDISQQDPNEHPDSLILTTELTAQLPNCGASCCPLGYNCAGNLCVQQKQTTSPASSSSLVPPVASPSTTSTVPPTVIGTSTPTKDAPGQPSSAGQSHSSGKTIAIAVPVTVAGIALILLGMLWFLKRRRRQQESNSYVNDKSHQRASSYSPSFMGTTPRPLSLPQNYVAPLTTPPMHARSQSEPQVPRSALSKPDDSTVSEPMWDPDYNGGIPLHRTDFLLRRGSVETGYEDKIKPSWSTRTKNRPKSILNPARVMKRSATEPETPKAKSPRRSSRLTPLFSTPLRFGLPLSPSPARNKAGPPAVRPPRSDENLARLVKLEGKSVQSGEAKRVSNVPPSPKKAKKMRVRDRSESARRPLVENADSAANGGDVSGERNPCGQSLERQDSDASATTIESESSCSNEQSRGRGRHAANGSTETINVLLPPPSVFHTPPPPVRTPTKTPEAGQAQHLDVGLGDTRRDTTFEEMMRRAGWRKSEWVKK